MAKESIEKRRGRDGMVGVAWVEEGGGSGIRDERAEEGVVAMQIAGRDEEGRGVRKDGDGSGPTFDDILGRMEK